MLLHSSVSILRHFLNSRMILLETKKPFSPETPDTTMHYVIPKDFLIQSYLEQYTNAARLGSVSTIPASKKSIDLQQQNEDSKGEPLSFCYYTNNLFLILF